MQKTLSLLFLILILNLAAQNTTIGIIGCHKQHRPAPALRYFADSIQPNYTLWVGDNVYADTKEDPQHIQDQLDILAAKDGFEDLKEQSQFLVTWDDHDYGYNNENKHYIFKEESREIHRSFWELESEIPEERDGVYYSKIVTEENGKKIQFVMLDGRYNKDKPGKKADALGENQWNWLEEQLQEEADLRFIVSGYQILLNRPTRWEAWAKQGKSKKRLFNLIKEYETKGVVFITGDQHYVEVLKNKNALGYDTYEIMAAGINQTERPGWAGKRVGKADLTYHSAPSIEIFWDATEEKAPHLHFTVKDVETDATTLSYDIMLEDIGL